MKRIRPKDNRFTITTNDMRTLHKGSEHDYSSFTFSGGEIHPTLSTKDCTNHNQVTVNAHLTSGNDIIELLMIKDIISTMFPLMKKTLMLKYTMFSRQDRVANVGEAFGLKVFCNLINSMNFDKVITYDNHSEVSNALLHKNYEVTQKDIVKSFTRLLNTKYDYIISPDAGANKKATSISRLFDIPMIQADKVRDTKTGEITGTVVHASDTTLGMCKVLIVDDICDGGRTVIEIAKVLKNDKNVVIVDCFFTHGIFSQGYDNLLDNGIDMIYTTDTFNQESSDRVIVKEL